jgi:hypothetical protein
LCWLNQYSSLPGWPQPGRACWRWRLSDGLARLCRCRNPKIARPCLPLHPWLVTGSDCNRRVRCLADLRRTRSLHERLRILHRPNEQRRGLWSPLLFYPPIWIRGLFRWCARPLAAAYCFTYVAEEAGGLLLLAYVMQHLPIEKQLRRGVSIAMALFSLSSRFGVNYTFFRCAGASLRWQRRCCWWGSWSRLESLRRSGADSEVACWDTRCCALRREFRWWLCGNEIYIALASTSSRHDFSIETQRRTNIAEMNGSLWDLLPTIAHSRRVLN